MLLNEHYRLADLAQTQVCLELKKKQQQQQLKFYFTTITALYQGKRFFVRSVTEVGLQHHCRTGAVWSLPKTS